MPGSAKRWTPERIVATLAAEIERLGFVPTTTRWCALGLRSSLSAVFAQVGSWRVAIAVVTPAAGDRARGICATSSCESSSSPAAIA